MKKTKLFKSLLLAAGLCVGASAWAGDVASHDFNSQTTPLVISDANRLSVSYFTYEEGGTDYYAKYSCGNMNAVAFAYYDFSSSVSDAATVTIDFDFYIPTVAGHELISIADASAHTASAGGFTGKSNTGYGANGAIFNLGCYRSGSGNSATNKFAINSVQNNFAGLDAWCHANVIVDNASQKVSYTITRNGEQLATDENVAFLNSSATRCSQIDLYIGTNASGNAIQVDNLVITKTVSDVSHNYTINAVAGETVLEELASGTANENAGFSVSAPRVIKKDDVYYVMNLNQANMSGFHAEYTMGTEDVTKQITYTADPSVIYFKECEDIQQKNELATASGGYTCGYYANPQVVTISEAGWYQLETNITGRDSNSSLEVYTVDGTESVAAFAKNCGTGIKTLDFEATGNMRIGGPYYSNKFNNSKSVDYLLVRKYDTYTAQFYNSKNWEIVYAYTYNTETMGGWPGTKLVAAENGLYSVTCNTFGNAPEKIIFNNGNSGDGNQTGDLDFVDGANYCFDGQGDVYNFTFTTNKGWNNVYAYAWSGEGESEVKQLGAWNGTEIFATDGIYGLTFVSSTAPEKIIFHNGDGTQTSDLDFVNGEAYTFNSTYVVAGTLVGDDWTVSEDNKLDENNTLTISKEFAVGKYYYKVVVDNTSWYPANDNVEVDIKMAGEYDIVITFDPSTNGVAHTMAVYKGISGAGYATLCAPYDLNFAGTGVTAYIAKKSGTAISFEEVTSAPANTGLLLKAAEGSYPIAMEVSNTNVEGNVLVGVLEDTQVAPGIFVLMNGSAGVGFYTTVNSFTVGANTAYIPAQSSGARFIGFDFDNTTTAIEGVATVKADNGEIYNLQGQRVVKAQKGLYIINGKKVVLK